MYDLNKWREHDRLERVSHTIALPAPAPAIKTTLGETINLHNTRPFAFEDITPDHNGDRIEPEKWGPVYNIQRQRGKTIGEVVRAKQISELRAGYGTCTVNLKADLKYKYSGAKARAACSREFHAAAARDRRAWATGSDIVKAYELAMAAKAVRLANERSSADRAPQRDAFRPPKPHYVLRDGKFSLAA